MRSWNYWKSRPRLLSALGVVVVAAALMVVPVSYQRTVGQRIDLQVSGPALADIGLERLTSELGRATRATSLRVRQSPDGGAALGIELRSVSPERAQLMASALVERLQARSLTAQAAVNPLTETVSGSVYAMVLDHIIVIDVDTEGKTDEEVEDEIRAQLLADGVEDPVVSYQRGDDETVVRVEGEHDGHAFQMVQREVGEERDDKVQMEIGWLDATRDEGMTDEELEAKILDQLEARGLSGEVEINGEEVRIRVHKGEHCDGDDCDHSDDDQGEDEHE
ncbi:hypothetical protein [Haliangium sp.]|uniref:hypothetical protein n=1 Tax=Haliangium sp. TaxID=2663208 RepID=UPI003D0F12CD